MAWQDQFDDARDGDPNTTTMELMGVVTTWDGDSHTLTIIADSRRASVIELDGLQTAALRAFLNAVASSNGGLTNE